MSLPGTHTEVQKLTILPNLMGQGNETTQQEVATPVTVVTQETISDSGSDWKILHALDSAGIRSKIKVSDKCATITPVIRQ